MKALILSIKAGMGHHKTGMAIQNYLEKQGVDCRMVDAYEYIAPALSEAVSNGYLLSTKLTPKAFGRGYELAQKYNKPEHNAFDRAFNRISLPKMKKLITDFVPDVIITTHSFAATMLTPLIDDGTLKKCLTIGVITDFTVHPFWEKTKLDYYNTASVLLDYQAFKKNIPKEKLIHFGIPIDPKFSQKIPKNEAREELKIENKPTVLVIMGSMGFGKIFDKLIEIDGVDCDFQVLLVCGNNKRLYKMANEHSWRHNFVIYGFVDNVDIMMDASDIIVTKPGGLTTSEFMAKKMPAIIMSPIPGQEDRNAEFLLNNGLAVKVTKLTPIDEILYQFLNNKWRLDVLSTAVAHASHPDSAKKLGDFIIEKINNK